MCIRSCEDAHLLFMISSEDEEKLFLSLIRYLGLALYQLAIIAGRDDSRWLVQAIETKNITYLTKSLKKIKKQPRQVLDLEGR